MKCNVFSTETLLLAIPHVPTPCGYLYLQFYDYLCTAYDVVNLLHFWEYHVDKFGNTVLEECDSSSLSKFKVGAS